MWLAACSSGPAPKAASGARSLEIIHEACAIDSGSAIKVDVNGDGSPDIIKVMSGGREVCRAIDLNFDKVKDAFIYFDGNGNERRRESDFDKDGRPDEIAIRQNGQLVSKELETNFDRKLDTWETYANGKLVKAERDSDADGVIDEWWDFTKSDKPGCAIVTTDKNQDGESDPDTAVDMCGEGYKPPQFNYTGGGASSAASGTAPGSFPAGPASVTPPPSARPPSSAPPPASAAPPSSSAPPAAVPPPAAPPASAAPAKKATP